MQKVRMKLNPNPGVSEDDQSYVQASIGLNTGKETVKILGLNWNTESDEFCSISISIQFNF